MRKLIDECSLLDDFDVTVLQLVEMGLCSYGDIKNGTLNLRDIIKMSEYAKVKNTFINIKQQQIQNEAKARKLWQK